MAAAQAWPAVLALILVSQALYFAEAQPPSPPTPVLRPPSPRLVPLKPPPLTGRSNVTSPPARKPLSPPPSPPASPPPPLLPAPVSPTGGSNPQKTGSKGKKEHLSEGEIAGIAIGAAAFIFLVAVGIAYLRKRGGDRCAIPSIQENHAPTRGGIVASTAPATYFSAGLTPMEAREGAAQLRLDVHSAVQALELHMPGQQGELALKPPFLPSTVTNAVMFQRYSLYHQCFVWLEDNVWCREARFRRWPLFPVAKMQDGTEATDPTTLRLLQDAVGEDHYRSYLSSVREGVEDPESETEVAIAEAAEAMVKDLKAPQGCLEPMKRVVRQAVIARLLLGAINKASVIEIPGARPQRGIWTEPFDERLHSLHMEYDGGTAMQEHSDGRCVLFCYEPGYAVGQGGELLHRQAMVIVVTPQ